MTEPPEIAAIVEPVVDGVWTWRVANSNIGGATSACYALEAPGGCVLIDPLRLSDHALASLPAPQAIVLTAKVHQRSAWRYRSRFGVEVWMPEGAPQADEEPDRRYGVKDTLPGGLRPIHTPGPEPVHFCLLSERGGGVLFCSDLLSGGAGDLRFVPPEYHDDPAATRRSVEHLLDLEFDVLCLDHGTPLTRDPGAEIAALLERG